MNITRKSIPFLLALGLLGTAATACGADAPTIRISVNESDARDDRAGPVAHIISQWTENGLGGVTVALSREDGSLDLHSAGVSTTGGEAMRVDDLFRVGSMTKTFVAVMLLQLVDEGRLVLDEQVTAYVPAVTVANGVSVRQLLNHTSGIPDIADDLLPSLLADPERVWTTDDVLTLVATEPRDFAPGTGQQYSSANFVVAGLVLEAVTGQSVADNLQSRITRPLGLNDTYFAPESGRRPVVGFSSSLPGGNTTAVPYTSIETAAGATAALVSTAPDLAIFVRALASGQLLPANMLDEMTRNVADGDFGLGIDSFDTAAGVAYSHGGLLPGFMSRMGFIAETGDVFVVLANDDARNIDDLVLQIIATTSGAPSTQSSPTAGVVDRRELINGASMHVRCVGDGPSTIVLIAGFNDGGDNWGSITPELSRSARVCSYARFGTGISDEPPATQTFGTQATDLRALLQSVGEPGPYLLVGHSYGGPEAVTFASMYPADVTGLVLIDASPTTWHDALCAVTDDGSETSRNLREFCADQSDPHSNSEGLDATAAFAEVAAIHSLSALPMFVVTAATHPFPGLDPTQEATLNEVWDAGQARWASLSSAAELVEVTDSGHYIQLDQPKVVIEQIQRLVVL